MQTQQPVPEQKNASVVFLAIAGIFGATGLCFMDAYTTFVGLQAFFLHCRNELGRFWVPLFFSCLTIGFTAYSTEFIEDSLHGKMKGGKPMLFVGILMICIFYDFVTGFLGLLNLMTGQEENMNGFYAADGTQRIIAAGLALIMVISPFIVGKFLYKIKEDPGFLSRIISTFFGGGGG